MVKLDGVVPVLPVPFREDESIDERSLACLADFAATHGAVAMCLPAYGSEFYKLTEAEREQVIGIAIEANRGRIPVAAQANHGSAKVAASLAKRYASMGADIISFAIPRMFTATNGDVLRFCGTICDAVDVPILIQDFNPGGPTMDAEFIETLNRNHANFSYAKLEEPMIIDKLTRIRDRVGDKVGILEGWGGYYMLEAIPLGICGLMPGVPLLEVLDMSISRQKIRRRRPRLRSLRQRVAVHRLYLAGFRDIPAGGKTLAGAARNNCGTYIARPDLFTLARGRSTRRLPLHAGDAYPGKRGSRRNPNSIDKTLSESKK